MLRLVSLCPQKMFYELSVILTDLFQNKKSIQTLQCLQSLQVLNYCCSTVLCCHTCFILPSSKVISHTTDYLVQWVDARISEFFLQTQIRNFPLDTSEIKLNVTPKGAFSVIQKHVRKYSLWIFKDYNLTSYLCNLCYSCLSAKLDLYFTYPS